jgi:hypothetical protein
VWFTLNKRCFLLSFSPETTQPTYIGFVTVTISSKIIGSSSRPSHSHTLIVAQHSTAQHSTAQHSTAQHSTAQHIATQNINLSTEQHNNTTQKKAQHRTTQHFTAPHSIA